MKPMDEAEVDSIEQAIGPDGVECLKALYDWHEQNHGLPAPNTEDIASIFNWPIVRAAAVL